MISSPFRKLIAILFLTICCSTILPQISYAQDYLEEISDPAEDINRKIFAFNDGFDRYLLEPVARGYHSITPDPVEEGIGNFFTNLRYPSFLVSDLVQFKFSQALKHTGRFLINSTVGVLGFIDVAKHVGLPYHEEDFGIALAYHGIPPGPYVVLPFLGPSTVRDSVGTVVDFLLDPLYWIDFTGHGREDFWISAGATSLKVVNRRAGAIEAIDAARDSALDYYLFMQSAYYQYRLGVLHDGQIAENKNDEFN